MPGTAIILVNWNGWRDTVECLESLLRLESDDFAIIVVDNGSTDGSAAELERWAGAAPVGPPSGAPWAGFPAERRRQPRLRRETGLAFDGATVLLVEAGANLGFAAANNIGMALATRDPATRFLWLLNNDTAVRPDTLARLEAHAAARPEQGIVGATLLFYRDPDRVQALGGWARPHLALAGQIGFGRAAGDLPSDRAVEEDLTYVIGASMFVRRDVYEATGGMEERYFLYFEEWDWARRLPPGVTQGYCREAVVYHKEGGSIGTSSLARPSDTSLYYLTANTLRFYWCHYRRWWPVALARQLRNLCAYALGGDRRAAAVMAAALIDGAFDRRRAGPVRQGQVRPESASRPVSAA
jgi:GT2 family glycosyltransferase